MRTRTIREGSVGLLILLGLGLFGALVLWLRGLNPGNRTYQAIVEFGNVAGLQEGASVRYRGVAVGRIVGIQPGPNGVDVKIEIAPADLLIPSNVVVEANQSGLISETSIDITPLKPLPPNTVAAKPLEPNCNPALIVCDGSRLQGKIGISVDELVRSSIKFAELYSDPAFFQNVNLAAKNTADAAAAIAQLTKEVSSLSQSVKQDLSTVSASAAASATAVGQAANQVGLTANQVNDLLASNRNLLVSTLENLNRSSEELQVTVGGLSPVVNRFQQSQLLENLETLSANAAIASANLRDASTALNSPTNVMVLQQTLDSARATFQNAQKITADLDELTGDPAFRENLRELVNGLSGLVSSADQLQEQTELAQVLTPLSTALAQEEHISDAKLPASEIAPHLTEATPAKATLPAPPLPPTAQIQAPKVQ